MSEKSPHTGKSMWDFAMEVEQEAAAKAAAERPSQAPTMADTHVADQDELLVDELGPVIGSQSAPVAASPSRKLGGVIAAGVAIVALGAGAFIYMQGTQTAVGNSSAAVAVGNSNAVIAERAPITPAESVMPIMPAVFKPEQVRFTDGLASDTPAIAGKSLAELVKASASVPPVAALPPSEWRGAECSSCHTWTEARLCDQGKWYGKHGNAAIGRVAHPFGGEFKSALATWANQGCQ